MLGGLGHCQATITRSAIMACLYNEVTETTVQANGPRFFYLNFVGFNVESTVAVEYEMHSF